MTSDDDDNDSDAKQNRQERQENWRTEYRTVTLGWRFFASLRFIVAAFAVTLQSALITLYNQTAKVGGGGDRWLGMNAITIAVMGLYTILAILFIEWRTVSLLREVMRRGVELEFHLGATEGFFHRLSDPKLVRPKGIRRAITHTGGLTLVYMSIFLLWFYLFGDNLIKFLQP